MPDTPDELIRLGYHARREHRLHEAKEMFSRSVALCRGTDDAVSLAASLVGLGQIERDLKNKPAALQSYKEAVDIYRSQAHPLRLAHTIRHLADILRGDDSLEAAQPLYEEALKIYRQSSETPTLDLANAIRGFALLKGAAGRADQAKALWREARALYGSVNVQSGVEESDSQIARLA
jgi:tetratricopeptide (TPR) repeat protein